MPADVALELILAEDGRGRALADELETLNRERQAVEERILREAVSLVESWPEAKRRRRGYVLWGADWHEGVNGIVASRLVERFHRPVVMIAGEGEEWKGSGRSISAFDLHGALAACAGTWSASAGIALQQVWRSGPTQVEAFAEAFAAQADGVLGDDDLHPVTVVDAVVPGSALTLELAQELERLAPFGLGNPDVTLLVAGCEAVEPSAVGEGRHLRFRVRQHDRDAGSAIAFGLGSAARPAAARGTLRRGLPAEGEPLERHRGAAAGRPPALRRAGGVRRAAALARRRSGGTASRRGRPRPGASSPSSSSRQGVGGSCTSPTRSARCSSARRCPEQARIEVRRAVRAGRASGREPGPYLASVTFVSPRGASGVEALGPGTAQAKSWPGTTESSGASSGEAGSASAGRTRRP